MSDDVGFVIEYVVSDSECCFHAIGRCGDHPIHVGDEFSRVYAPALILRNEYPGLGEQSTVKLRVKRIQAYQHELETLGRGMTGTIDVSGEGLQYVIPGAVLGTPAYSEENKQATKQETRQSRV